VGSFIFLLKALKVFNINQQEHRLLTLFGLILELGKILWDAWFCLNRFQSRTSEVGGFVETKDNTWSILHSTTG